MDKKKGTPVLILIAVFAASNILFAHDVFADCDGAAIELHTSNQRLIGRLAMHEKIIEDQKKAIEDVQKIIHKIVADKVVTPTENKTLIKSSVTLVQKRTALVNSLNVMTREIGTWFGKIHALENECK